MRGSVKTLVSALSIAMAAGMALAGGSAQAGKFKVLHSFGEARRDGLNPSGLMMDVAGNLFGTTVNGGNNFGTVFELERNAGGGFRYKELYRFCPHNLCQNGRNPSGPLIVDVNGNLYGTANDVVFELSPVIGQKRWSERVLYHFCSQPKCADGNDPAGGLTYAGASSGTPYDGSSPLFGVTGGGGTQNGGTVFKLVNNSGNWAETVLYSFCSQGGSDCTDGYVPTGGLVLDPAGNLYGVTVQGGGNKFQAGGAGVIFEFSPSNGTETVLYRFCGLTNCADGARPVGRLAMDAGGGLFGATTDGGECDLYPASGCGVLYRLTLNSGIWQQSVLYTFCQKEDCLDGAGPMAGPTLDSAGIIYGTTFQGGGRDIDYFGAGGGLVFSFAEGSLGILHRFCSEEDCADGEYPASEMLNTLPGFAYGTTQSGGSFGTGTDGGTAFRVRQNR